MAAQAAAVGNQTKTESGKNREPRPEPRSRAAPLRRAAAARGEPPQAGLAPAHRHAEGIFRPDPRSEEHTSELQSLMRISYAVFCLKKKNTNKNNSNYIKTKLHTI